MCFECLRFRFCLSLSVNSGMICVRLNCHSHSNSKSKRKMGDTEGTAIAKSSVSSIKCQDVNKNNRLDYQQRIQTIAKSPVSNLRDTDNLAIACIRYLPHMKISISASSKSHVDLETISFLRTRT